MAENKDKDKNKKAEPATNSANNNTPSQDSITQKADKINTKQGIFDRRAVLEAWRKTIPISVLKEKKEPPILGDIIIERAINVLVSGSGSGKSLLAASIAINIAKRNPDMIVFYLDYDNPDWLPNARGIPDAIIDNNIDNLFYILRGVYTENISNLLKEFNLSEFENEIKKQPAVGWLKLIYKMFGDGKVVVIFDALQRFHDYNNREQLEAFYNEMGVLRTKGYTFLVVHHLNKANDYKGLGIIKDDADAFFKLKSVVRNNDGEITEQVIEEEKGRLRATIKTIRYIDMLEYEYVNDVEFTNSEKLVLNVAISQLKKHDKVTQSSLVKEITSKVIVGEKKTRKILDRFDGSLFIVERGDKNAKIFKLNYDSDILKFFEKPQYTEVKKNLLDYTIALIQSGEELTTPIEFELAGKMIKYDSLNTIRNNILSMKHEEAEEVLEILSERYHDG